MKRSDCATMRTPSQSIWLLLVAVACGNASDGVTESTGGASAGSGGSGDPTQVGTGGSSASSGGAGSHLGTGGSQSPNATGNVGGTQATGGGNTGGALPTGGVSNSGGVASGGGGTGGGLISPTGGTPGTGGSPATGGWANTGGRTGGTGSTATGGSTASGSTGGTGSTAAGGTAETGGSTASDSTGGTTQIQQVGGSGGAAGSQEVGGMSGEGGLDESGGAQTVADVECGTVATPGELITFNDDGGWCWYQDERVIVDPEANKLIIGSVAIGGNRNGNVEVSMYDLVNGGAPERSTLGDLNPDDHNTAGLTKLGENKYVAVYTTHNDDCNSYYNVYQNGSWGPRQSFSWNGHGCPTDNGKTVSYSNLWHMGAEVYNFVRSTETSPNLLVSTDGSSWSYAGRLTSTERVGYVAGYYKYWGNNIDRIDFVGTEAHPRDNDNSLYHGYVQGGKIYKSDGTEVDNNLLDGTAQNITAYTKLFATGSRLGSVTLTHLWNCDLMRYEDGTIALIFTGRANGDTNDPDKRFGYARFDGSSWKSTYLVNAGHKLYDSEQDYTGLGALHPNNPNTIYISTTHDPRDETKTFAKHEIWRGTTCDGGQTFDWTPITQNSTLDNLRPIVPYWDSDKTVLLWMKGTYHTAQTYDTSVVGVILDGV